LIELVQKILWKVFEFHPRQKRGHKSSSIPAMLMRLQWPKREKK